MFFSYTGVRVSGMYALAKSAKHFSQVASYVSPYFLVYTDLQGHSHLILTWRVN